MDEATQIIVLTSLVQTVVITLTLLVFIFQFRGEERAIKESSYQNPSEPDSLKCNFSDPNE